MDYNEKICAGYLKDISRYKLLTEKKERELMIKKCCGDSKARETLINCNLRLVVSIAKLFADDYDNLLSYIQIGNIGLIKAVDNYSINFKNRLSTYAFLAIFRSINDYIYVDKEITVPICASKLYQKIKRIIEEYKNQGMILNADVLSQELSVDKNRIVKILSSPGIDPKYISRTENGDYIYDIECPSKSNTEVDYEFKIGKIYLDEFLKSNLTDDEINILKLLNGYCGEKYSYNQVAKIVGSTRNEIINEEKRILRKLRTPKSFNRQYLLNAKEMILEK